MRHSENWPGAKYFVCPASVINFALGQRFFQFFFACVIQKIVLGQNISSVLHPSSNAAK
jgi:hypothetical protein